MIVTVTGGYGFVGVNLISALVSRGIDEVRIVDDLSVGCPEWLEGALRDSGHEPIPRHGKENEWGIEGKSGTTRIRHFKADVKDCDTALRATKGANAVVHLAAQTGIPQSLENPARDFEINCIGTVTYLEACRQNGVGLFMMASSAAVLGGAVADQVETAMIRPISPYGASKAAGESYCSAYSSAFGIRTLSLRFSNVYGRHSWKKGSVVATFCRRALSGEPLIVYGDGQQLRDFIFIEDLAAVVAEIILAPPSGFEAHEYFGQPLNVATGVRTSVAELASGIQTVFGESGIACTVETAPLRPGDVQVSAPNIERLRLIFPDLSFHPLSNGLAETIGWFIGNWRPTISN